MNAQEGSLVVLEDDALEDVAGGMGGSAVVPDLRPGSLLASFFSQLTGTPYVVPKGSLGFGGLFGIF